MRTAREDGGERTARRGANGAGSGRRGGRERPRAAKKGASPLPSTLNV
ncbi:hypothetical protein SSBG_05819 [Streptomyces sp. SPB074]|nr:hypothetical protein SSBG_05819 [Streptomyces sp. SPB074]